MTVSITISISLFYHFLKKYNKDNEDMICLFNKSLIILCFLLKNHNLSLECDSSKKLNNFFISYYLYSIFNHLKLNIVDFYMIYHHVLVLNFLVREKYAPNRVNNIHGNLIIADYLNVISPIICKKKSITGKQKKKDSIIL